MNNNQLAVINVITDAILSFLTIAHFLLEGAGGTGKTFLYQTLCSCYHFEDYSMSRGEPIEKYVICVTSTGIAGLLMLGGQTAHSFFAIPLDASMGSKLKAYSEQAKLLYQTQLIIWDKVAMQSKEFIKAVDKAL